MRQHKPLHYFALTKLIVAMITTTLLAGCSNLNVNKLAYEILRQEDCRLNQLEEFCLRSYAVEYHEYELMRQEFLRSQIETDWRTGYTGIALPSSSMVE